MFEKEAKEYTHTKHCEKCSTGHCEKKCILVKDDYEAFKDGAEFGYNKANEWHFVENGDLPKIKKRVLVLLKDVEEPILDYYRQDGLWNYALENEVIAWKEIILPQDLGGLKC